MATGFESVVTESRPVPPEPKDSKTPAGKAPRSAGGRRRRQDQSTKAPTADRFFLAGAGDSNGKPDLNRELPTEAEAIVESFRTGRNYYRISEWRTSADTTAALPIIRKEAVTLTKDS